MAGLIGAGRNTLSQATGGFSAVGSMQQQRNAMNDQLDAARKAQRMSMVTTGAGLGASVGVNNLMRAGQAAKGLADSTTAFNAAFTPEFAATLAAPEAAAGTAAGTAATGTAAGTTAATTAGTTAATAAGTTAATAGTAAGTTAATTAATTAGTTAGSTGLMAGIGAVATPLLIGAGAALLLDSLFDIF